MANSTLIKTILRNSIAEGIYKEITNRSGRYFYFLGKTLTWDDELSPVIPVDSITYGQSTRNEIITVKEITPTDVSFVIPRYEWVSGIAYDQYDDQYSTEVQGVNLTQGGTEYTAVPFVYIGSQGHVNFVTSTAYSIGQLLKYGTNYYVATSSGTSGISYPSHTLGTVVNGTVSLLAVIVYDSNGSGATAVATLTDGVVTSIDVTNRGTGYTMAPSLVIAGEGNITAAIATAVVTVGAKSTKQKIEDCEFYVLTDDHNVYVCLDNNNNANSTSKPVDTDFVSHTYPDGYVWKFMYNVPIGLRNKFLTTAYVPVVTSIQSQFYSNGNIQVTRVDQAGTGYTGGSIAVIGDGYLESNPLYLYDTIIEAGGTGYVTPTITIESPFTNVVPWSASYVVVVGQKYSHLNNIYEVVVSGTFGSVAPVHKYGIVANGSTSLKYVGTNATATVSESGGVIDSIELNMSIREVNITFNGSGYTAIPAVTFMGGAGTGAAAIAVLSGGTVSRIIVIDSGEDYTAATIPTIKIGTVWTGNTVVTLSQQICHATNLYTVTGAGTTHATVPPTHTSGAVLNGTATFTYVGEAATATCNLKCGAGYSLQPLITISGAPGVDAAAQFLTVKSDAKLIPLFVGGQLSDIQIDDGGVGYTYAVLTVSGDGTGATASAQLSIGDANTLQSNIELLAVDGAISNIPVISSGFGYTTATVVIAGDGTGAVATAHIVDGAIIKINITNSGQGYRWATATITGDGDGAKLRVIIAPYGGMGREAINNLFARTLMFYSNVSADKNQGFAVNNDYRQLGILKNARQFGSTYTLTVGNASACWVISADTAISTVDFPIDSLIYLNFGLVNESRFRIVSISGSAILVQALDNGIPVLSATIQNDNADSFIVSTVTPPTMDKYSGDLLFIDNKQAFTPGEDQIVTIRTVLKF